MQLKKVWNIAPRDNESAAHIATNCGIDPLLAQLLINRGLRTVDEVNNFLTPSLNSLPDPFLLKGMFEAVDRLTRAVRAKEHICVVGDFDADGVTGTALMVDFFRQIGATVSSFVPRRLEDGYGLTSGALRKVLARKPKVIVTVDCGISSIDEAASCRSQGIDLIVTDHHTPGPVIPDALAVINPLQPGCDYPFKKLAGVGVAYNLAIALRKHLREVGLLNPDTQPNLTRYLDIVAIGTIGDVVPLLGVNRVFVSRGLKEIETTDRPGTLWLRRISKLEGVVSASDVGFRIAPRINATGRLGDSAASVDLLLTRDYAEAKALADNVDACNGERQHISREILEDVLRMVRALPDLDKRQSIVLASEEWHAGVIGIIASKVVELFHKPTILISLQPDGSGKASGRSIPGVNLYDALAQCSGYLSRFGGHSMAAGLSISQDKIAGFARAFERTVCSLIAPEDMAPVVTIDADVTASDITKGLAKTIDSLEPFGAGNENPVFLLKNCFVKSKNVLKDAHLKLKIVVESAEFDVIGFGLAEGSAIDAGDTCDLVFSVGINRFRGQEDLQLYLKDYRHSESECLGMAA